MSSEQHTAVLLRAVILCKVVCFERKATLLVDSNMSSEQYDTQLCCCVLLLLCKVVCALREIHILAVVACTGVLLCAVTMFRFLCKVVCLNPTLF